MFYIRLVISNCEQSLVTMAELQCLESIKKRTRRPTSHLYAEPHTQKQSTASRRKNLYDVEVIEEDGAKVKIHYIGYSTKYDEWKSRDEVILKKPRMATDFHPLTELACQIKKRLLPSRHQDPSIRIQVPGTREAFTQLAAASIPKEGDKYTISSYADLEPILGEKWFLRIANKNRDFSYVILSTVEHHLTTPRSLLEYEPVRAEDGTISFEPVYLEQCYSIVFTFVRGDGNRKQLSDFL